MKGNFHDQFLEGWVGAIPPDYSARAAVTPLLLPGKAVYARMRTDGEGP